jgi:hypothetical protein
MASTTSMSDSVIVERRIAKIHKYRWPAVQLNVWMFIMLVASGLVIGTFATFLQIQQQLNLYSPWCVFSFSFSPFLSPSCSHSNYTVSP